MFFFFLYFFFSWVLGDFLCKMYQFVHSLSYTASIFILVVICMERYFAIIHPITCKQILTSTRLRVSILFFLFFLPFYEFLLKTYKTKKLTKKHLHISIWKGIINKLSKVLSLEWMVIDWIFVSPSWNFVWVLVTIEIKCRNC